MNAGKSTSLLQVAHNYEEQGQQVQLYTAAIDNRYGVGLITSRLGPQREVGLFDQDTDFLANALEVSCVLVDEAQFLTKEQVVQLHRLAQVRGDPFPGSAYLLALADDIEEIKNICTCGKKATMNIRVDAEGRRIREGEQVSIGGNESYRQACGRCFYKG
jgi:thymidine kinase